MRWDCDFLVFWLRSCCVTLPHWNSVDAKGQVEPEQHWGKRQCQPQPQDPTVQHMSREHQLSESRDCLFRKHSNISPFRNVSSPEKITWTKYPPTFQSSALTLQNMREKKWEIYWWSHGNMKTTLSMKRDNTAETALSLLILGRAYSGANKIIKSR